jgi:hypothetical protein
MRTTGNKAARAEAARARAMREKAARKQTHDALKAPAEAPKENPYSRLMRKIDASHQPHQPPEDAAQGS